MGKKYNTAFLNHRLTALWMDNDEEMDAYIASILDPQLRVSRNWATEPDTDGS